jgi:uncharacterized protein
MAMKFQRETGSEFAITAYTADSISVGGAEYRHSLRVAHQTNASPWPVTSFEEISAVTVAEGTQVGAEIVIIGTGNALRFPKPETLRPLIDARIGFEVMTTAAACRTYNILLSEGRRVAALLLIE